MPRNFLIVLTKRAGRKSFTTKVSKKEIDKAERIRQQYFNDKNKRR